MFAEPGHEADEVIELLIKQHSAARRLTVVSSDHRLQTAIRHRRGIGLDSDLFLKGLGSLRRNIQTSGSLKSPESDQTDDLEFWKQEFEDVSPEKLGTEVSERSGEKKNDWDRGIDQLQQRLKSPADLDDWLNEPNNL